MAAIARQLDFSFPAEFEVAGYLDDSRWGSFSVLIRHKGSKKAYQRSYKLCDLPEVLAMIKGDRTCDYWISQAVFRKFNRLKGNLASIGTAFVDLDYYTAKGFCGFGSDLMLDQVLRFCGNTGIPEPSVVIDSGRGLQVKWFHEPLPKVALPRWEALQRNLVNKFEHMGGDHHSRDVSRVLRIVNTVNQKNMRLCELIYVNNHFDIDEPVKYRFNELCQAVLPEKLPANDEIIKKVKPGTTGKVTSLSKWQTGFSRNSLNWTRMCDLQNLINIRGGDVGEGLREPMAFYLCNFFALRYYKDLATRPLDNWNEFRNLCLQAAPHWDNEKIKDKTSNLYELTRRMYRGETVEFNGKEYPPLYTPTNARLIEDFKITDDKLLKMKTIISKDEKRRRNTARKQEIRREAGMKERKEYDEERKAQSLSKSEKARQMKADGFKNKDIAEAIGVHVKSVSRYLRG